MLTYGIAEAARKMRKNVRTLYRHLDEYKTIKEEIEVVRIVWNEKLDRPVKSKSK